MYVLGVFGVLVVDSNSMVQRRNVELANRIDLNVLVVKGLEEGEHVIVRGLQQVRPGMHVDARALADKKLQD